jgi:hypothetical protein
MKGSFVVVVVLIVITITASTAEHADNDTHCQSAVVMFKEMMTQADGVFGTVDHSTMEEAINNKNAFVGLMARTIYEMSEAADGAAAKFRELNCGGEPLAFYENTWVPFHELVERERAVAVRWMIFKA